MNIILMILDALRYDHVNTKLTPNLVKIADEGVFFNQTFACNSATKLSVPCILSSHKNYDPDKNIATVVKKHGYHPALIHSNPIMQPFLIGFEEIIDIKASKLVPSKGLMNKMRKKLPSPVVSG